MAFRWRGTAACVRRRQTIRRACWWRRRRLALSRRGASGSTPSRTVTCTLHCTPRTYTCCTLSMALSAKQGRPVFLCLCRGEPVSDAASHCMLCSPACSPAPAWWQAAVWPACCLSLFTSCTCLHYSRGLGCSWAVVMHQWYSVSLLLSSLLFWASLPACLCCTLLSLLPASPATACLRLLSCCLPAAVPALLC